MPSIKLVYKDGQCIITPLDPWSLTWLIELAPSLGLALNTTWKGDGNMWSFTLTISEAAKVANNLQKEATSG